MNSSEQQYRKMTETPVRKLVLKLAGPTILSMLITSIYNLADTYFVGQLNSNSASGAVGVVASLMNIIQAMGFMLGHGAGSMISRKLGAHDTEGAVRLASTSFFTGIALGLLLMTGGLICLEDFMYLLGSTDTILPHACGYATYILLGAPVMISSIVMNNILRYEGKAFFSMCGLVSGGILNMLLDPLFIFVFKMGTAGAGAATAISQCVSFSILLSAYLRGKTVSRFVLSRYTRDLKEFFTILATGFPSFVRQGIASIASMLLNNTAKGWGDEAVAAMSIVSRIFMLIMSVGIGIGQGFQPVSAFNYGAKKYKRVKDACLFTAGFSFLCMAAVSLVLWFVSPALIRAFRDDPAVAAIAIPAFRFQDIALLCQPVMLSTNMLLQSVGRSGKASFLALCRQGIFFIPLILILPRTLGILGLELCQPISDLCSFLVSLPFLISFLRELDRKEKTAEA